MEQEETWLMWRQSGATRMVLDEAARTAAEHGLEGWRHRKRLMKQSHVCE
jgi:hypothetical protein